MKGTGTGTLPDRGKYTPFISILNIDHCLKYLPFGIRQFVHVTSFLYKAAVLALEGSKSPIFVICKDQQIQIIICLYMTKVSLLMDMSFMEDKTGILIFMPTSKSFM